MNNFLKRTYDIVFAVVFLILTSWIMLITAIIIKSCSKGPVFYVANRVGKNGIPFRLYKFRSMIVDSGEIRVTTLATDERIYPFGKFIRNSKIDELPQLINILVGNMSVVGPRPEDVKIANEYYVSEYKDIYSVKPGLTSPASLFDYTHGELYDDEDEYINEFVPLKLKMELYYVENQSFMYDIRLSFRTAVVIFKKLFMKNKIEFPPEYKYIKNKIFEEQAKVEKTY